MKPIREFCKKGTTQETVFDMKEVPANEADDYLFKEDMFTPLKKGRGRLKQLFERKLGACTHMTSNDLDAGLDFDADVVEDFRWIKELQLLDTASSKCKSQENSFIQFCF